ncbi:KTSC domain-containing protein [Methylophilus sp. 14]|uniref:KTSC domain-containing protein n=1 Tax=Methylophilus sp. 14 TaxID=2781019 RepID=UPI00188E5EE5|nr:KTSC domain-containing protein [Methylophilus sp. 14]MBF4986677.1 KTSC domain-containing protein [Methylophilus sp. 14]
MDMIKTHSGKLRAIGYDASKRILRVELEDGNALEYANVGESIWRNLKNASAAWSYYRDNIEEEFTASRVSGKPATGGKNPLDDLFG